MRLWRVTLTIEGIVYAEDEAGAQSAANDHASDLMEDTPVNWDVVPFDPTGDVYPPGWGPDDAPFVEYEAATDGRKTIAELMQESATP